MGPLLAPLARASASPTKNAMARAMTPDDEATIARRYSAGEGIVKLAREYRVRTAQINKIIAEHEARRVPVACSICSSSPVVGRGWCRTHYNLWRKQGDPQYVAPPRQLRSRFTAVEQRQIAETYLGGGEDPSRVIAILTERYGCSKPTIYRIVRQHGGQTRSTRVPRSEPTPTRPTICTHSGCDMPLRTNAVATGFRKQFRYVAARPALFSTSSRKAPGNETRPHFLRRKPAQARKHAFTRLPIAPAFPTLTP